MKKYSVKDKAEKQGELPGMPEKAEFVVKGEELLELLDEAEALKEDIEEKKLEVLQELIKANRNDFFLRGRTISRKTLVKDTVVVKKQKEG